MLSNALDLAKILVDAAASSAIPLSPAFVTDILSRGIMLQASCPDESIIESCTALLISFISHSSFELLATPIVFPDPNEPVPLLKVVKISL